MKQVWDTTKSAELFEAIATVKTSGEARQFLRDLLTSSEIVEFSNRWAAARMLSQQVPYSTIEAATGLSSATIARVSRWLQRGMGGYKLMLNRLRVSHHGNALVGRG